MTNLLKTVTDDITALNAAKDNVAVAKKALTTALTTLVQQFNVLTTPRATLTASLTSYVNAFNTLTTHTNTLRACAAQLTSDMQPAFTNLNNTQLSAVLTQRQQYIADCYVLLVNIALMWKQADGLTFADLFHDNMIKDINKAWAAIGQTPPVEPAPSVLFDTTNALNIFINNTLLPGVPTPNTTPAPTTPTH